jgi:hypothetical protein
VTPAGSTPITIEVTARGVTLRVEAPEIALHASGDLSLSAETLKVEGRRVLTLASGGELAVAAEGGSVSVEASDDVKLTSERVMVNCDETIDRYYRDRALEPDLPSCRSRRNARTYPHRIAEYGDEEVDAHLATTDDDASLAEGDLELMTRRRLEPNRRHLGGAPSLAVRCECPLQRPQPHVDPTLDEQLPRHHGITGRLAVEHGDSDLALVGIKLARPRPLLRCRRRTPQVPPSSDSADSERRGDALGAPAHRG